MSAEFRGADGWHSLDIRRHPRARRAKLRIDALVRRPVLTLPPRASAARAARWVESQRGWIEQRLTDLPPVRPLAPGAHFPFRGEEIAIRHKLAAPRRPKFGDGALTLGGPADSVGPRVLRWLRGEARRILESESRDLATRADLPLTAVSVGDARTRWGSCSSSGRIRYSWRLILAPSRVLSATVAHEVAHLRHMHHGPEFHAFAAELFGGDPSPERAWLRSHGASLYNIGSSLRVAGGGEPSSEG